MTSDDDNFSLKAAIERANQDFAESPDWLREIHRRNRELAAFLKDRLEQASGMVEIAALFVDARGCYAGLEGVDAWPEARDARLYAGPHPVVAHPPCTRWCRLAGLVEKRWGYKRGDDGGCFAAALEAVRKFGGVLEHPAYSDAWKAFSLPRPDREGGWKAGACGGFSAHIEQGRYGHAAKKATWLYAYRCALPELRWGAEHDAASTALVSWCGNRTKSGNTRKRLSKKDASATPPEFRDVLIAIARSARDL